MVARVVQNYAVGIFIFEDFFYKFGEFLRIYHIPQDPFNFLIDFQTNETCYFII